MLNCGICNKAIISETNRTKTKVESWYDTFGVNGKPMCQMCSHTAKNLITFTNKVKDNKGSAEGMGFSETLKWVEEKKKMEQEQNEKISFLSRLFQEKLNTDIELVTKIGSRIPAHRALLATRSIVFESMMGDHSPVIRLPELNHEELETLHEFLYRGDLPIAKVKKHVCSLMRAADKYDISFLKKFCHHHMHHGALNLDNALDILETVDTLDVSDSSNANLRETTMDFIVRNMPSIVSSTKYEALAVKSLRLSIEITKAYVDKNHPK